MYYRKVTHLQCPKSAEIISKKGSPAIPFPYGDTWCESLLELSENDYAKTLQQIGLDSNMYKVDQNSRKRFEKVQNNNIAITYKSGMAEHSYIAFLKDRKRVVFRYWNGF